MTFRVCGDSKEEFWIFIYLRRKVIMNFTLHFFSMLVWMLTALPSGLEIHDDLSFLFICCLQGLGREQIDYNNIIVLFQLYFNTAKHILQIFRKEFSDCLFTYFFNRCKIQCVFYFLYPLSSKIIENILVYSLRI